ncbi:hypothetical protein A33Y_055 [Candidatus Carsonella ruddii CS isolate Thao2000]|uniref:Uncharacterized protein n=1 Tax=Candidatus Carsonella ruddii CS isolate Thao2000 TaxID=1202537 RepID=J7GT76_CARRU|nr:hypothetical protein [Candidatus Carsonella ruddii]AFP83714.1 hypothetical protein A33Y_055 [Candidatus Carsonella ruddii CS isolate Thao2000]
MNINFFFYIKFLLNKGKIVNFFNLKKIKKFFFFYFKNINNKIFLNIFKNKFFLLKKNKNYKNEQYF